MLPARRQRLALTPPSELWERCRRVGDALIVMALIARRGGNRRPSSVTCCRLLRLGLQTQKTKSGDKLFILRRRIEREAIVGGAPKICARQRPTHCSPAGEAMTWQDAVEYALKFDGRNG